MTEREKAEVLALWRTLPAEIRRAPASEETPLAFEAGFGPIPGDFRWFLAHCGGGEIGAEWVDDITRLAETHRTFREEAAGPGGWGMRGVSVSGWDGAGNPFGIEHASGRVLVEDYTFGGVHECAPSFYAFLRDGLTRRAG